MKTAILIVAAALAVPLLAGQIDSVKVTGDKTADVVFNGATVAPTMQVDDNTIDLVFADTKLADSLGGKVDLLSPHTLVQRVSAYPTERGAVRAKLVINGTAEGLRQRLQVKAENGAVHLAIRYPAGADATLSLLKEEQAPLGSEALSAPVPAAHTGWGRLFVAFFVFALAGGGTYVAARFMKKKGAWVGSRKYLVENLAFCPVGPGGKSGVSLIKVGSEFVLVGVTPNQVSFLSNLPRLAEQYETENKFERDTFRAAVEEEVHRMKTKSELTV